MKREDITKLLPDISKDTLDTIMNLHGQDIEAHKAAVAAKDGELSTANQTIKDLQDAVKKFDGVDVQKLKDNVAEWEKKYTADLTAAKLNGALEAALMGAKSKNTKAVRALLNMEEVKLDGDKLLGLDTQLEKLKAEAAYLFDDNAPPKPGIRLDSGLPHGNPATAGPQSLKEAIAEKMNTSKGE